MIDFDMDSIIQLDLRNKQLERGDRPIHFGYYSASQTGYCLRKQYWDLTEGNSASMDGMRNMEMGNIIQDHLDGVLLNHYGEDLIKIERTFTIPLQTPNVDEEWVYLTGRIDHVNTFIQKNNRRFWCPIEAKYMIDKLIKDLKKPNLVHLNQIITYLIAMNGDTGFLYYVDHHFKAKTFRIELNNDTWNNVKVRVFSLHDYIKHDELPPAEALYDKEMKGSCWFCSHYKQCDKVEKEKQK